MNTGGRNERGQLFDKFKDRRMRVLEE